MKYKLVFISTFFCLLLVLFPLQSTAAEEPGLRPPSGWSEADVYQARWSAPETAPAVFRVVCEQETNQIFIGMELTHSSVHPGTKVSSQLIIHGNGNAWIIDLPNASLENGQDVNWVQTDVFVKEGTQMLLYTLAIALPAPDQYEIALTCRLNETEIRPQLPITVRMLPSTTAADKTTQPERSTKQPTAPRTAKGSAAPKSTTAKPKITTTKPSKNQNASVSASTQTQATDEESAFSLEEEETLFGKMTPGTKVVFCCAVLAGAAALVITGLAIGSKHKPEPAEEDDDMLP